MKRIFSLVFCFILVVACLSGCANSKQTSETDETTGAAVDKVMVETAMGPVEIPANPKRIASALIGITGYLAALDTIPVGTATQSGFPDYIKSNLAGSVDLGETDSLNLEALMELEPDLIIGIASVHKEQYELLSAIAPTVLLESATDDWATFHTVAQLVGKEETAFALQKEYDERISKLQQEIKEKYPQGAKVAYMRVQGKELQILNPASVYFKDLYRDMSWSSASEGVVDFGDGWNATISMEALPQLDMDYLILAVRPDETSQQAYAELKKSAVWQSLEAVKKENTAIVDANIWFASSDPIALNIRLDNIEDMMLR
ncbi:iron complex transport system substrate-binding protein [Lacrimispora xylanisolvens]|uniref:Iron complex transport system substrate-binding protein n=1 Tax=Lacrimispora xylanisolvens TaxID=384636 RepID=A0A2S6HS96_9FIRM|nr:iron-siderophore ABC transporter substrate-binding protein [Hungatella xylanolytica]PPK80451.1 iron complex transport system substrate-binding protein [Hungatella xylanolytica]